MELQERTVPTGIQTKNLSKMFKVSIFSLLSCLNKGETEWVELFTVYCVDALCLWMFPWSWFAGFNETSNLNVRDETFKTPWILHVIVYYIYICVYVCVYYTKISSIIFSQVMQDDLSPQKLIHRARCHRLQDLCPNQCETLRSTWQANWPPMLRTGSQIGKSAWWKKHDMLRNWTN